MKAPSIAFCFATLSEDINIYEAVSPPSSEEDFFKDLVRVVRCSTSGGRSVCAWGVRWHGYHRLDVKGCVTSYDPMVTRRIPSPVTCTVCRLSLTY